MGTVWSNQQRCVEKNLLTLRIANAMFNPILVDVSGIPFKTGNVIQLTHYSSMYTTNIYI
jgi:hypothetical protein